MLAQEQIYRSKAPRTDVPKSREVQPISDSTPRSNPLWNSLAMHGASIQPKVAISQPGDAYEREADQIADRVMRTPESPGRRASHQADSIQTSVAPVLREASHSTGEPLAQTTRDFMEARLGHDLGHVRTHTDGRASRACRDLNAQAFTHHQDIYFGAGRLPGNDALTAHELTHVVQQTSPTNPGQHPSIQRKLELRPPGKGEASAFGRAQELVDRLNTVSPAIQYDLKGQSLNCTVKDAAALTHFDNVMKGFIDRVDVVPMRLLTSKGYVGGGPLFADSFINAYVDLDDLLADDIYSFQSDLLHFLTERFQVKRYEHLIGTNFTAQFDKAHQAGKDAEAAQLQYLFNDPSIVFNYEQSDREPWVNAFKSKDHGYRVVS